MRKRCATPEYVVVVPDRAGFTLVELLLAMGVLILLVMGMGNLFNNVTRTMDRGLEESEQVLSGQTAVDLVSRELSTALFRTNTAFQIAPVDDNTSLRFFSVSDLHETMTNRSRSLYPVEYRVENGDLLRSYVSPGSYIEVSDMIGSDWNSMPHGFNRSHIAARNVTYFEVMVTCSNSASGLFTTYADLDVGPNPQPSAATNAVPLYADISLGVLSDKDWRRVENFEDTDTDTDFIQRREQAFSTRVYFKNR